MITVPYLNHYFTYLPFHRPFKTCYSRDVVSSTIQFQLKVVQNPGGTLKTAARAPFWPKCRFACWFQISDQTSLGGRERSCDEKWNLKFWNRGQVPSRSSTCRHGVQKVWTNFFGAFLIFASVLRSSTLPVDTMRSHYTCCNFGPWRPLFPGKVFGGAGAALDISAASKIA